MASDRALPFPFPGSEARGGAQVRLDAASFCPDPNGDFWTQYAANRTQVLDRNLRYSM
jgi:hypothetical protein